MAEGFGPGLKVLLGRGTAIKPGDTCPPDRLVDLIGGLPANTCCSKRGVGVARDELFAERLRQLIGQEARLPAPAFGGEVVGNGAKPVMTGRKTQCVQLGISLSDDSHPSDQGRRTSPRRSRSACSAITSQSAPVAAYITMKMAPIRPDDRTPAMP